MRSSKPAQRGRGVLPLRMKRRERGVLVEGSSSGKGSALTNVCALGKEAEAEAKGRRRWLVLLLVRRGNRRGTMVYVSGAAERRPRECIHR